MSDLCIYLPLEDYLAQWFVNEHGGERPVHLLRGSVESKALETYLEKLPEGGEPEVFADDKVPVRIPTFRTRPPETYNYLPPRAPAEHHPQPLRSSAVGGAASLRQDWPAPGRAYLCLDGEAPHRPDGEELERYRQTLSAATQHLYDAREGEKTIFAQKISLISA